MVGGLGISILTRSVNRKQVSCAQVTAHLVDLINSNAMEYPRVLQEQEEMKTNVKLRNCEKAAEGAEAVKASLTKGQQNAVEQASERGTFTWLTAIPMTVSTSSQSTHILVY